MNRKQLITLLVLVLVVGGAGLLVYKNQVAGRREGNLSLGQKLLPNLPVNDVTRIGIKQGADEVNLVKKEDLWRVRERGDYPANFPEISGFLLKARDLKILESEQVGPSQLARLGLADAGTNNVVVVDLRGQNDKEINKLLLGKKHMRKSARPSPMGEMGGDEGFPDGRYVKVGEKSDKVVLISDPLENLKPTPQDWLSKDFIKVEKIRSVAVTFPQETNSWKLARETESGEWKLADAKPGEELDSSKASGLNHLLSSPSFTDVIVDAKPAELGFDKPTTVSIETFDHLVYNIKAGAKTNENYPITINVEANLPKERPASAEEKPEDKTKLDKEFQENQKKQQEKVAKDKQVEKWTYLVSTWTLDAALKERSQLMAEKKEDKPAEQDDHAGHAHEDEPPLPQSAVPVPEPPARE